MKYLSHLKFIAVLLLINFSFLACTESTPNSNKNDVFIWGFGKPKKYIYRFTRTTTQQNDRSTFSKDTAAKVVTQTMKGKLVVKVKKNKMADLIMTDVQEENSIFGKKQFAGKNDFLPKVQVLYQDYPANGQVEVLQNDITLNMFFPLPPYDFATGGSAKKSIKMPFRLGNSLLFAKGNYKLYFNKRTQKQQRNCAVLYGKWDISDLTIPEELDNEAELEYTGEGTYYFDYEKHCFVSSEVTLKVKMKADMKMKSEFADLGKISMNSTTKTKLELIKVEE